jgi:RNA polymerase sigma-70 factor (ECF subfamily)
MALVADTPAPSATMRAVPVRDDDRLAKRLRRGDRDALRDVYARFGAMTFGLLMQLLRDRAGAEDVQQQVFLEVWQRRRSYDPARAALGTWILTITRSRAIDELRRRIPEPRDPAGSIAVLEAEQGLDGGRVDELVEQWHLADLVSRLPAGEADLLRRRFHLGQSQSEIAEELGIPLGTVKSRMGSGLDGLRRMLEEEGR